MQPLIRLHQIIRDYHLGDETIHALRKVSLDIHEGEFVTFMGASGSGKSTLLNILGCLDRPGSGEYTLDSAEVSSLNEDQLADIRNRKIGFVFQSFNLLPRTSALENVELPLLYRREISAKERRLMAIQALESVGLADRREHFPGQLSGGQQQRVAIARALVHEPRILLADEATGNLDTRTSYEIMALFQELNRKGKTILFVTHEADIAAFSKRTVTLKDGVIIEDMIRHQPLSAKGLAQGESLPGAGS